MIIIARHDTEISWPTVLLPPVREDSIRGEGGGEGGGEGEAVLVPRGQGVWLATV